MRAYDEAIASSIGAISNVKLQVFEHVHARQFRATVAPFFTVQFRILPARSILSTLLSPPALQAGSPTIGETDGRLFAEFQNAIEKFKSADKLFWSRSMVADD